MSLIFIRNRLININLLRTFSISNLKLNRFKFTKICPEYDTDYLTDPKNIPDIMKNIVIRKGVGDIKLVHTILDNIKQNPESQVNLGIELQKELRKIPNKTHPDVTNYGDIPKVVQYYNTKRNFDFKPQQFGDICKKNNLYRMENLGNFTGHKSYYLMSDMADLEQALIKYAVDRLLAQTFVLISVPDILPADVIEGCGMSTSGERNQVYKLDKHNLCLSGTSEMALAAYFAGTTVPSSKLPIKKIAVSRCYRAETSGLQEERGIFRVHQFHKVEMFSVCSPEQSSSVLDHFKDIQIDLFKDLGLHFKLLDMPPCELGAPAYRKYDIETLMPGRDVWGEISSCSDCTDYQARRLEIRFNDENKVRFAHTVNGTACAIPRMLIAIVENNQNQDGSINIPGPLQSYMKCEKIVNRKILPQVKFVKSISINNKII